ncbi:NAD(P)-binding protein [Martensiomyces pterosporus]|nr:NAD(P)-binding protein [Martensiomyces pterosporus]
MASPQATVVTVDHVYIVTGAGRGLGRSIAKVVAKRAAAANELRHLILVGRSRRSLELTSEEAVNTHTRTYIAADIELSQPAETTTEQVIAKIKEVVGGLSASPKRTLHITLIQCAGTVGDLSKTVDQYTESEITAYVHLNLVSYSALTARFLEYAKTLAHADRIAVVNISSLLAVVPFPNWGLYAAIKAARDQILKVVALEHKGDPRVKTLSYAPGPLEGDMQADVRNSIGDAEQKALYSEMHKEKKLVNREFTADLMCGLLDKWSFESGAHIDIYDVSPPPS